MIETHGQRVTEALKKTQEGGDGAKKLPEVATAAGAATPPSVTCPETMDICTKKCEVRPTEGKTGCIAWIEKQREIGRQRLLGGRDAPGT